MSSHSFYFSFIGFIFGIALASYFSFTFYFGLFCFILSLGFFFYFLILKKEEKLREEIFHIKGHRLSKKIFLLILFLLFVGLGILRYQISSPVYNPELENQIGKKVTLLGVILVEPDEKDTSQRIIIDLKQLKDVYGNVKGISGGRLIATLSRFPQFSYGDEISITGKLEKPKNFETDTGREFDYINYLKKEGIGYQISFGTAKLVSKNNGNFIQTNLFALKNLFLEKSASILPEPQSSLLGGLIVGAKKSLPQNVQDEFKKAGIIHIVVLSGFNISIIAVSVMYLFSFFPRFLGLTFGAISIVLFGIMTGGTATVVRACIMALLVILSQSTGRMYNVSRALFVAGFLMLFQNPKILAYDPSFQLSFLATFGIIFFFPIMQKYFNFLPEKYGLRNVIGLTISSQIFLLPLLLYMTGNLSIVALPVNILILPIIPLAMLVGFVAVIFAFFGQIIALPFAFLSNLILSYILFIPHLAVSLPYSTFQIKNMSIILLIIWYGIYGVLIARYFVNINKNIKVRP